MTWKLEIVGESPTELLSLLSNYAAAGTPTIALNSSGGDMAKRKAIEAIEPKPQVKADAPKPEPAKAVELLVGTAKTEAPKTAKVITSEDCVSLYMAKKASGVTPATVKTLAQKHGSPEGISKIPAANLAAFYEELNSL